MGEVHRDWTKIPVEILHRIFQYADKQPYKSDTRNFALVCKAWLIPAQGVLYTTVAINTYSQYKKFHNTVTCSQQLEKKVKTLKLEESLVKGANKWDALKISYLLTKLLSICLINLEEIQDRTGISYNPTLKALQNAQLKQLKKLSSPNDEFSRADVVHYIACAFLLKDRLINIQTVESANGKQGCWDQIYDKLCQFPDFHYLSTCKATYEDICVLEHVTASCPTLKGIGFWLSINKEEARDLSWNNSISIDSIKSYIPAPNIEELNASIIVASDYKILLYIMHKFPRLQNLFLELTEGAPLDHQILTRLLEYSSNIREFVVCGIRTDYDMFCGLIGNNWNTSSRPGKEGLQISYTNEVEKEETCLFEFWKGTLFPSNVLTLKYPISNLDWKYIEFIKKYGKFIGELDIGFFMKRPSRQNTCALPKDFLQQVLTYCPNLRDLHFGNCTLERLNYSSIDFRQVCSLNELCSEGCIIYSGVMEQLSLLFCNIKRFCIDGYISGILLGYPPIFGTPLHKRPIEIIMPNTEIHTIVFEELYANQILYIRALDITTRTNYYYQFDKSVESSNEQEYTEANDKEHVYICCRTNLKFKLDFEFL